MRLHIIIISILIIIASFASFSYAADTGYFDLAITVDNQTPQETNWSEEGSFTVLGSDTEYFDLTITINCIESTNDSGGGWLPEDEGALTTYLMFAVVVILFPLAIFVRYSMNGNWRLRR